MTTIKNLLLSAILVMCGSVLPAGAQTEAGKNVDASGQPADYGNRFDAFLTRIMTGNTDAINRVTANASSGSRQVFFDLAGRRVAAPDTARDILIAKGPNGSHKLFRNDK